MTQHDGALAPGRLILIRHGETDHNAEQRICGWTDSGLSALGVRQTRLLAAYIARAYHLDRLYASPLQRAWLTAEAIAEATGLAAEPVEDLREIHFGELEGLDFEAFQLRYPDIYALWRDGANMDLHWPGGESRAQFRERVNRVLTPLEIESRDRAIAVVCHGGVIGSYLAHRVIADPGRWREFTVRNCSVTEIGWRDGQPVIVCHDIVEHLMD